MSEFSQITQDNLDEENISELNKRIFNLINQMRLLNGSTQPIRLLFINESTILNDELRSLLSEDGYKDEQFYVDFLADIHGQIQNKLS